MSARTKLVSVIIPAYNASAFIEDTIRSICGQSWSNLEIIVIDDGSSDNTVSICATINDTRLKIIRQENSGVATARNNGLKYAKGEYVVFFDADDLMSPEFLALRVHALEYHPQIGYVGGLVETFPSTMKTRKAAASDPVNEILFFNSSFVTVPSNYLFRKEVLVRNKILFNDALSSSADRFFILEVSKVTRGKYISNDRGKLLYRFSDQSMSNKVTPGLIIDNEKFYYELKRKNLLPPGKKQKFKSFYFLSLAKGFGMVKNWRNGLKYLAMSFLNHPVFFAGNFGKTVFRSFPHKMGKSA